MIKPKPAPWTVPEGISQKEVDELEDGVEVHRWSVDGCAVFHVRGRPYTGKKGHKVAQIGRGKETDLVTATHAQFHRGDKCPNR